MTPATPASSSSRPLDLRSASALMEIDADVEKSD